MRLVPDIIVRLESMPRITRQELCDNMDDILDRIDKEKTAFVIKDEGTEKEYVLCPASWYSMFFDDEFGCIINAAVRYAIGRHTYMPGVVKDFVIRYISALDLKTLMVIETDIDREMKYLGNGLDYKEVWVELYNAVQKEIKSRSDNAVSAINKENHKNGT